MKRNNVLGMAVFAILVFAMVLQSRGAERDAVLQVGFCPPTGDATIPRPWELKINKEGETVVAEVVMEEGSAVLHMRSVHSSFSVQREFQLDPATHPYLSWMWKAEALPPHGDLRESGKNDQALQILVAFDNKKVISYVWDSNAPRGTVTEESIPWPFTLKIKVLVVRSGASEKSRWSMVTRDVSKDYRQLFGGEAGLVKGIRVQMNTQHTESRAEGYVKNILVGRSSNIPGTLPPDACSDE